MPELRASLEIINQTSGALISDIDRHFHAILQERRLVHPTQEADNPLRNAEMAQEDDYNMIDGILNNGAREMPAKEKPSLLERIKSQPKMERKNAAPQRARKGKGEMENFTREEINLMCIYNTGSQTKLIENLNEMRSELSATETELMALTESTLRKLRSIPNQRFAELELLPDFDE